MKTANTCTTIPATRCTRRPTFRGCAGTNAPEGNLANACYANLVSIKGWVGTFRPFCDA